MKTIKKAIALVLTALMVLSLVPAGVSAQPSAGMTLAEFKAELTPRMESFYANITPEQATILKAMGDSLNSSTLSPYTTVDAAWTTILGGLVTPTLVTKYGSTEAATAVLAKMLYSAIELMFYMDTTAGTDSAKLEAAIDNAYTNLYLPMDVLAGHAFTQAALSSILNEVKSTISSQLSSYANAITNAMNASATTTYVNTIANSIASVAVTNLFNNAAVGSILETLKNNFSTNAGFTATDLGTLVKKIYVATATVSSAQKAPSVQFNLLINTVITFQGAKKDTDPVVILPFDQAISLSSATEDEVSFKVNPNRTIAGIDLDMTSYFEVSSPDNNIISATKVEDLVYGGYYIKLKAKPNVATGGTYYVSVYRHSVADENYFFNVKVNVVGIPVDKSALTTAITNANTLIASKTVGAAVGNVSQAAKDDFQAAITAATNVKDDANATELQVSAQIVALGVATTAFNNAIVLATPKNVEVKKVGDAIFSQSFETLSEANTYVMAQADAVKLAPTDKTVRYYAVPKDNVTPIANKNISVGKLIVCDELDANSIIPDGAVVWASTNGGSTPVLSSTDYYTKGVNAFPTIAQAVTAAAVGAEVVIKDGTYEATTIDKQLLIRNGSHPIITGAMIFAAAAAGSTIEGITFGTGAGGALATITVNSPDITIANLSLDNVALVVNAADVAIQNVTVVTAPAATSVITVNAAASNTTISGFSFTENTNTSGAAITVAAGVTGTTITDSVIVNSADTVKLNGAVTTESNIYAAAPVVPVTTSNTNTETNVVLNVRKVASAAGKITAVVYLTGLDNTKSIDAGHAVIGYTLKTLSNPVVTAIPGGEYDAFSTVANANSGIVDVAYNKKIGVNGYPVAGSIDLFSITYDLPALPVVGDVYSIWLSRTSPNNELIRSIWRDVANPAPNNPVGNQELVPLPMLYTVSSVYIFDNVPVVPPVEPTFVTLTVHIQLPFEVKNNLTQAEQGFNVEITDSVTSTVETYNIYSGAAANPYSTHAGATLVPTIANGYVSEYVLTLPGYVKDSQYDVKIKGLGYTTVERHANLSADLSIYVWNNIRSATGANFLAGDIIAAAPGDTETVNNSDFVAIAGKYGMAATDANGLVKYDINRDQKVDLKDVVYLLLNMKNFRTTY